MSSQSNPSIPDVLAAAERRAASLKQNDHLTEAEQHDKRQHFRRLIDPGIIRPNGQEVAMASLKTLLTVAENLLREPDNPKYQRFKPTNDLIKRRLIDPKGTLEYAIALGFHPEVENFQPFYVFNPRRWADLVIGAEIIKEKVELESQKQERLSRSKKEEKAATAAIANHVKLAFMDDRKSKSLRDEREKQLREARAAAARLSPEPQSLVPVQAMPGSGVVLATGERADGGDPRDEPPSPSPEPSPPPPRRSFRHGHLLVTANDDGNGVPPPYSDNSP